MNLWLPQFKALCMAENASHVQHNVLTLRGAQVRDAKVWAHYLDQSLLRYGEQAKVVFAQHHWPTWVAPRSANTWPINVTCTRSSTARPCA